MNPENVHIFYSNRSAAHLKKGDADQALQDANACLKHNPDFPKGYSRKGAALHALQEYESSIQTYQEGIAKFPDHTELQHELIGVKRAEVGKSRAAFLAHVSQQQQARSSATVSTFCQNAKRSLSLQIHALQSQLELIQSLERMTTQEKVVLLFGLIDKDHSGLINARELADAIRQDNADLALGQTLIDAIDLVAAFDADHDAKLNLQEFQSFLESLQESIGVSFQELSEFLILTQLFSDADSGPSLEKEEEADAEREAVAHVIDEAVHQREVVYDAMRDPRMSALYHLFDKNGDGEVDFSEVATGLFRLTHDMKDSSKLAVSVLLMMDHENERRVLDFEGFSRLIVSIAAASGKTFEETADQMTMDMMSTEEVSPKDMEQLMATEQAFEEALEHQHAKDDFEEVMDALQYNRMQRLFDLWDTDNDEGICYEELVNGLRKFQKTQSVQESAQNAASLMVNFDEDNNQTLNRIEFATSLVSYSREAKVTITKLVDFLVVASVLEDNSEEEKAFIRTIATEARDDLRQVADILKRHGIE